MKKMIFVLTALLLAAPAMADVDISCEDLGDGVVAIKYDATGDDANLPRGLGLDITVTGANVVDFNAVNDDYWVYPGSIVIDGNGVVTDEGQPVVGTLPAGSIIVEMGSLHYPAEVTSVNAPPSSGTLLTITVDGDCDVAIAGNAERGEVVNYAAEAADAVYTGCSVTVATDCFPSCHPDYTKWVSLGKPASWCYPRQCHGDADGAEEGVLIKKWVSSNDLAILISQWQSNNLDADFDHEEEGVLIKKRVSSNDLAILIANWQSNPAPDCLDCP